MALVPNSSLLTKQMCRHSEANSVIFVQRRTYPASLSNAVCKVYLSRVVRVKKQKVQNISCLTDCPMQTKPQSVKRICRVLYYKHYLPLPLFLQNRAHILPWSYIVSCLKQIKDSIALLKLVFVHSRVCSALYVSSA